MLFPNTHFHSETTHTMLQKVKQNNFQMHEAYT